MGDRLNATNLEGVRRKATPELRKRFANIQALLGDGYTHKQICEQLNADGLAISYDYFRVVMARLRAEKKATAAPSPTPDEPKTEVTRSPNVAISIPPAGQAGGRNASRKMSWDPEAPVKWK